MVNDMVNSLGTTTKPIKPTLKWCIVTNAYRNIIWLMNCICKKYPNEVLRVFRTSCRIYFDDGVDINEFEFVVDKSNLLKGTHADIYVSAEDFEEMWLLQ